MQEREEPDTRMDDEWIDVEGGENEPITLSGSEDEERTPRAAELSLSQVAEKDEDADDDGQEDERKGKEEKEREEETEKEEKER